MKKLMTKVMGIALAVAMVLGSGSVFAANDLPGRPADTSAKANAQTIAYEQTVNVDLSNGEDGEWFVFTPERTGYYRIMSSNRHNIDPACVLYRGNMAWDYDYFEGFEFTIIRNLNAGTPYYIWATRGDNKTGSSSYDLRITWGYKVEEYYENELYPGYATELDAGDDGEITLSVSGLPYPEEISYQWYRTRPFDVSTETDERIAGATGPVLSTETIPDLIPAGKYYLILTSSRTGESMKLQFPIIWNNDDIALDGASFSLGDEGVATTAVLPEPTGSYLYDVRYTFLKEYNDYYYNDYLYETPQVSVPAFHTTYSGQFCIDDQYLDTWARWDEGGVLRGTHIAFVKREDPSDWGSNSGVLSAGDQFEVTLHSVEQDGLDSGIRRDISAGRYQYGSDCMVYSFTPEVSGSYTISSSDITTGDPFVALFDSGYNLIGVCDNMDGSGFWSENVGSDLNFSYTAQLEAGRTYYYVIWSALKYDGSYPLMEYEQGAGETVTGQYRVNMSAAPANSGTGNGSGNGSGNSGNNGGSSSGNSGSGNSGSSSGNTNQGNTGNGSGSIGNGNGSTSNSGTGNSGSGSSSSAVTPTPAIPTAAPSTQSSSEPGVSGFVERLYSVALGRTSDPSGKQDWIDAITMRGETGASAARGFLYSPEFLNKECTNEEFVAVLYRTFFDREPDQDGFNAWVGVLNNGTSKEEVIEGFINSTEWANLCLLYGIANGGTGVPNIEVEPNEGTIGFATRLYTTCLNREADEAGLMAWARQLANRRDTGTGAAHGFFFSSEFLNQNVSNEEFVNRLYRTFMGREADQAGFDAWVGQLNSGVSREEVFNGFAASQEFGVICSQYGILR